MNRYGDQSTEADPFHYTRGGREVLARGWGEALVWMAIESRSTPPQFSRENVEKGGLAAVRRQWEAESWFGSHELAQSMGVSQPTVYRTLKKLADAGELRRRKARRRDSLGRWRPYVEYKMDRQWTDTDTERSRVWLEIDGKRYRHVHEWRPGPAPTDHGWLEVRDDEGMKESAAHARQYISMMVGSRWAYRRGLPVGASPYQGLLKTERWEADALVSHVVRREITADPRLVEQLNEVLDHAERGEQITLRARIVVAGEPRQLHDLAASFRVERKRGKGEGER